MYYKCNHCGFLNEIESKSNSQNAYLHLLFGLIADKSGYTAGQVKILMKEHCNLYEDFCNKKTGESYRIYRSVADMTKKECSEFIDAVYNFAVYYDIKVLTPEEYFGKLKQNK